MNEYEKIVKEIRKRVSRLTLQQQRELLQLYDDVIKELAEKASKSKSKSLTKRWVKDYLKELEKARKELAKELNKSIKGYTTKAAKIGTEVEQQILSKAFKLAGIDPGDHFTAMFSQVQDRVVKDIISGNLYKDKRTLSHRIWNYTNEFGQDIQYMVNRGLLEKKSAIELAKDLEEFVKEPAKRETDWGKVYPNLINKRVDYNAMRLARTSINHAYQTASIQSSNMNPFVEGIQWHSAMIHGRTCEVCMERHGQVFPKNNVPLDHPNGLCTMIPYIPKDLDTVAGELKAWIDGGSNPMLDKWYKDYREHFSGLIHSNNDIIKVTDSHPKLQKLLNDLKDKIKQKGGIIKESDIKEAGKLIQNELQIKRADLKAEIEKLEKEYKDTGIEEIEKQLTKLRAVKRGLIDPDEVGLKDMDELNIKYDELMRNKTKLQPKIAELENKLKLAREKYRGTLKENAEELKKKLSEIREVGIGSLDVDSHLYKGSSRMRKVIKEAYDYYPTDWIEESIARGNLIVKKADRGYYSDLRAEIAISGWDEEGQLKTALHELGHRFEKAVPGILEAEKIFYERRTAGEDLKWLGGNYRYDEKSRFDKFLNPYMGKDYGGRAYELVSMGFEYAYTNPTKLWEDEDFATWIYGILALY